MKTTLMSPCLDCKDRELHCHNACRAYRDYQLKLMIAKHVRQKAQRDNDIHASYVRERHHQKLPQNIDNSPLHIVKQ